MKILGKLSAIYEKICRIMFAIAAVFLFAIFFMINFDVIKRTLGLGSTLWVIEFSVYSIIFIVFLGASWVLIKDKHIKVDIVVSRLRPMHQALVISITSILSSAVSITIMWYSAKLVIYYYQKQYITSGMLEIPFFILYLALPIGSFFLFIQFARIFYKQIAILKTKHVNKLSNDRI